MRHTVATFAFDVALLTRDSKDRPKDCPWLGILVYAADCGGGGASGPSTTNARV